MAIAQNYFSGKSKGGRIGTIVLVANVPTGFTNKYILCNGQSLDAFQYRRLHRTISNIYGGDQYVQNVTDIPGSTSTFKVPDLRGRVLRACNDMTDASTMIQQGGSLNMVIEPHALTSSEVPSHTHGTSTQDYAYEINVNNHSSSGQVQVTSRIPSYNRSFRPNAQTGFLNNAAAGHSHSEASTLQPSIYLNYYIQSA
jgi:microcystin-dependent protein|tara:strand:- start:20 stop:613 length:594 start_codon:yes stop_codon:yes gene_type:complete